jgi:hypothetical protein
MASVGEQEHGPKLNESLLNESSALLDKQSSLHSEVEVRTSNIEARKPFSETVKSEAAEAKTSSKGWLKTHGPKL